MHFVPREQYATLLTAALPPLPPYGAGNFSGRARPRGRDARRRRPARRDPQRPRAAGAIAAALAQDAGAEGGRRGDRSFDRRRRLAIFPPPCGADVSRTDARRRALAARRRAAVGGGCALARHPALSGRTRRRERA